MFPDSARDWYSECVRLQTEPTTIIWQQNCSHSKIDTWSSALASLCSLWTP